jgi:hypothetical protein
MIMQRRTALFSVLGLCGALALPAFAHPDHDNEALTSPDAAASFARVMVSKMVEQKALDASWAKAMATDVTQTETKGVKEWRVKMNNPAITEAGKQDLYIFLSAQGQYIAANYSGK